MPTVFPTDTDWRQVRIGAGGWVTGIDIHDDGTIVARTDTAGAYIWTGTTWAPLVTAYSMPANTGSGQGVYEIRIAPSDSNIMYMEANGNVYKSVDRGEHWTQTAFSTVWMDANGVNRMDGQKMAIDPDDPNTVYAGTQRDGLWVTRDGGEHWQRVSEIPRGDGVGDDGLTGIVIHNGTVYVGTAGNGVYRSTDGGHVWQAMPGGPADVGHAAISPSGELYVTGNSDMSLWKFASGTWTKVVTDNVHAVAIDPFNSAHIVIVMDGGSLNQSQDSGATWSHWNWNPRLESSDDVPWLEVSGAYMSVGGIAFDTQTPNILHMSAGVGTWSAVIPSDLYWDTPITWNSRSAGIENLVTNDIIAPRGGNPIFASWDRPFFEVGDPESYATEYNGGHFSMGWSLDYASSDSSFIVGISDWWGIEESGFSLDGGHTFQRFEGLPSFALTTIGGSIAASSPTNFIWAPAANTAPAYTLDGGRTWSLIDIPGKTDWNDFHWSYYLRRTTITADRVEPNTFYLYDVSSGVYVTRDGGVNWDKVFNGQVSPWSIWNAKIEAVPGSAGELFFTSGSLAGDPDVPADVSFMHSRDGGATWQAVAGVQEVATFGYGAPKVDGGPATVFIVGFVEGVYGVWYSTDGTSSWTQIGSQPMGNLDTITTISGDMDQFGTVYAGLGGNGYVYLSFGDEHQPVSGEKPGSVGTSSLTHDFNGDGRSDLVWLDPDGVFTSWYGRPDGSFEDTPGRGANAVDTSWRIVGSGDFNGDGSADLLWRHSSGVIGQWHGGAKGGFVNVSNEANSVDNSWSVVGVADYNGDGYDDILWRHGSGIVTEWISDSNGRFTNNSDVAETMIDQGWTVAASGDFNGDHRADILWQHSSGAFTEWQGTQSGALIDAGAVMSAATGEVVGAGDFNGDGRVDVLTRDDGGFIVSWLAHADGDFVAFAPTRQAVDLGWQVGAVGDYNGDGRDDLIWQHTSGVGAQWFGTADGDFIHNGALAFADPIW